MMKVLSTIGFLLIAFAITSDTVDAKSWRGIVPLKSTRTDVERSLGKPGAHGRYQFEKERAYIHYNDGRPCSAGVDQCECYAADDTVIEIYVELEERLSFSQVKLDMRKYKKTYSQDPDLAIYSNDEAGIIYIVSLRNDDVDTIQYLPSAKDCKELMKKRKGSTARITSACSGLG